MKKAILVVALAVMANFASAVSASAEGPVYNYVYQSARGWTYGVSSAPKVGRYYYYSAKQQVNRYSGQFGDAMGIADKIRYPGQ